MQGIGSFEKEYRKTLELQEEDYGCTGWDDGRVDNNPIGVTNPEEMLSTIL